ncbi:uncharacterized protein EAE97_004927 [Botrytis byssoidea]|uniref:N-acetyltransferase domain-containing protein n=1 Tax=Botrytis byssoidea TaxID=139641 RepID=A0A9P5LVN1_9HELO|nr:uncharacterized protein EAE97_004927 [Botrytis byssoidea]KAF7945889.1 hypothetical protein EAE97_004927 [Botrytis byssoidea]
MLVHAIIELLLRAQTTRRPAHPPPRQRRRALRAFRHLRALFPAEESPVSYIPVGTLRLLPYPDTLRPLPHTRIIVGLPTEEIPPSSIFFFQPSPTYRVNPASTLHDGVEPYVRLGRLAVLKEYRGRGYADLLIQAALKWAGENPRFSEEALSEEEKGTVPEWKGLVCLYARDVAVRTWERNGFVVDEGMVKRLPFIPEDSG